MLTNFAQGSGRHCGLTHGGRHPACNVDAALYSGKMLQQKFGEMITCVSQ